VVHNGGQPYCPHCGCLEVCGFRCRPIWRCKDCGKQFSVTSGTLFHSRKLAIRDYLAAIAIFVNGAKGHAALHLSRDLNVQYKTAFVLAHKLREAMGSQVHNPDEPELAGAVAIDGAYFGGKVRQANRKEDRADRRTAEEQTGKRQVVVVAREILRRTLPFIVPRESAAVPMIRQHVASGTTVHADESGAWDCAARVRPDAAGQPFSRVQERRRRLHERSGEPVQPSTARGDGHPSPDQRRLPLSVRKRNGVARDHRREPNGLHFRRVTGAALRHPKSEIWRGYWQRSAA